MAFSVWAWRNNTGNEMAGFMINGKSFLGTLSFQLYCCTLVRGGATLEHWGGGLELKKYIHVYLNEYFGGENG